MADKTTIKYTYQLQINCCSTLCSQKILEFLSIKSIIYILSLLSQVNIEVAEQSVVSFDGSRYARLKIRENITSVRRYHYASVCEPSESTPQLRLIIHTNPIIGEKTALDLVIGWL
jgi:hypothetical protein